MTKSQKATFAMGCFWHVQALFDKTPGVVSTKVGYTGGDENAYPDPSYEQVCSDKTEHAEAIQITFNSEEISYEKLLEVFWKNHDATQVNRQGPDTGKQYRSAIFYHDEKQNLEAHNSKEKYQKKFKKKIATQISPATKFHNAEEYHQKYLKKQGLEGSNVC
jgi:peptide-methionine (S)-S-oxide reductase